MREALSIGIMLDFEDIPLWISRVIEKIKLSGSAHIRLILWSRKNIGGQGSVSALYRFHELLDRLLVRNRVDYDQRKKPSEMLGGIPSLSVYPDMDTIKNEIAARELDLILNFSSMVVPDLGFTLARYGVWHYSIEDESGRPSSGYKEMVEMDQVLAAVVRCTNGEFGKEAVIYRNFFQVNYNSIHINRQQAHSLGQVVIPRLITDIYLKGRAYFESQRTRYTPPRNQQRWKTALPSNTQALLNLTRTLSRLVYKRLIYRNRTRWYIRIETGGKEKILKPPRDRFWADPFVVSQDERHYVFVEELFYNTQKGHITLLELDKDGDLVSSRVVLERPYHLSYPFVFNHEGTWYMIPESSSNRTIELYRCTEFPGQWSFVMNLMEEVNAVDTTIFYDQKKWWLFTSINESKDFEEYNELYLYHSNDLFSNRWVPHCCNPISTDIRTARPAGRIFMEEGKLIRPSQDCSERYGKGYNLNQICELNETGYSEKLIRKVRTTSEYDGTHTYNSDNNIVVTDVYHYCKRL